MKDKKRALGRGLEALIPNEEELDLVDSKYVLQLINVQNIVPNALQPRKVFADDEIFALSESIKAYGVLQPIIVHQFNDSYEIVAGERRWRAAIMAGLSEIPALVMNDSERHIYEVSLIENIQRVDLNPLEEARAYHAMTERFGMTQQQVSEVVNKSRAHITNMIRLLQLADVVHDSINDGKISMGHARCLITLDREQQEELLRLILLNDLSVRQTEVALKKMHTQVKPKHNPDNEVLEQDVFLENLQFKLSDFLGTKVHVNNNKKSKEIVIQYYNDDDLERLLNLMNLSHVSRET